MFYHRHFFVFKGYDGVPGVFTFMAELIHRVIFERKQQLEQNSATTKGLSNHNEEDVTRRANVELIENSGRPSGICKSCDEKSFVQKNGFLSLNNGTTKAL